MMILIINLEKECDGSVMENPKEVEMSNLWIMCPGGVFKVMNVISNGGM
jgi:hypothetical protein